MLESLYSNGMLTLDDCSSGARIHDSKECIVIDGTLSYFQKIDKNVPTTQYSLNDFICLHLTSSDIFHVSLFALKQRTLKSFTKRAFAGSFITLKQKKTLQGGNSFFPRSCQNQFLFIQNAIMKE